MNLIGTWGRSIVFRVSRRNVFTFENFSRTVNAKWTSHNSVNGGKPAREFQGTDSEQCTMKITISAALGVNVHNVIKSIENAVRTGQANYLIIGGRRIGFNKYNITKVSEKWDVIYKKGRLYQASLNLTFTEYT